MIKMVRLISGENICGRVTSETKTHTRISDPLKLETHIEGGYRGTVLTYWVPLGPDPVDIPINNGHIVVCVEVHEELENHYTETIEKIKSLKSGEALELDSDEDEEYNALMESLMMRSKGGGLH